MKNILSGGMLGLVALLAAFSAFASEADDKARQAIKQRFNDMDVKDIQASPIPGIYRVTVPPRLFYVSADAKYAFNGDVIDLDSNKNVTKPYRSKALVGAVNAMDESMIAFAPAKTKHTVTVFTDVDCGYCRKLHNAVAEYNKLGIEIRYLAFPRAGVGSESYNKMVSAWCADKPKEALTKSKNGQPIPNKTCDNPVSRHYMLGQMIGISGTPAIILEDGQLIPGYVPPQQLLGVIEGHVRAGR